MHPGEQWDSERGKRLAPMHAAEKAAGAVFFETVGWERPMWYGSNEALLGEYGDAVMPREHEWDSRWWSPIINAEHLAMRERAGIVDLSAFAIFDIVGSGAAEAVQKIVVAQADVGEGRVIYTPVLDAKGGFRSDLTVMRLAHDRYRVVTGGAHGMADLKWFADHLEGDAQIVDQTSAFTTIGLWGPRARDILGRLTDDDISHTGFGFLTCRTIELGNLAVLASRISYVGELGWELYVPMEQGARLWELLHEAGKPDGAVPVGIGVYGTTGRIEKGYRAFGFELDAERTIIEAGMQRPKVKAADFVGRDAYVAQRDQAPQTVLCTMTVDDHTSAAGGKRYMLGGEPIRTRDGGVLTDGHGHHPYVTTAGSAPSLGKHVLHGLPAAGPGGGGQPAGRVLHGGAVPGDRRIHRRHPAVRPVQRPDQGLIHDERTGLHQARAGLRGRGAADRGRTGPRRPVRRVHRQRPRELRGRARRASQAIGGTATVLSLGPADTVEQLRGALGVGATAAVLIEADPVGYGPADIAREIAAVVKAHEARGQDLRPDPARQRRRRHRRLPGRHPARLRAGPPGGQRGAHGRGRRRRRHRPGRRHRRRRDLRGAAARRGDRARRAASSRATRRSPAG